MRRLLLAIMICLLLSSCRAEWGTENCEALFYSVTPKSEIGVAKIIRVKGVYYYEMSESNLGPRCGVMDGRISSDPAPQFLYELPKGDNEANFGAFEQEYGYQLGAERDELELLDDGTWWTYKAIPTELNAEKFDFVYTLGDDDTWLIFSDSWLRFEQIKSTLENANQGVTKGFSFVKI